MGSVLLVAGEAGVGKTRLLRTSLAAHSRSGSIGSRGTSHRRTGTIRGRSCSTCSGRCATSRRWRTSANDLLERFAQAQAEGGTYSRTLVVELVDRIRGAIRRPTLMVFEDCQWADDLSLEAIGELARHADARPVFIVCAYRLDETPPGTPLRDWRARLLTQRLATEVRLERLTRDQTATVTTLLSRPGLPAPRDVVDAVYDPIRRPAARTSRSSSPRSAPPARSTPMPSATRPSRIDRGHDPRPDRTAITGGAGTSPAPARSSVGASCRRSWPGSWTSRRRSWATRSAELVDHAILYDFGTVDEGYYDFRHQLLRDALYGSTPEADRRRFHARAGEFGTRLEGQTEVHTSLHYELAGLREQAYCSALDGAQAAARVIAHREAFWLYRRAVANMPADLPDLDRARLLDAFAIEACAIEENEVGEQATWDSRAAYRGRSAGRPPPGW